LLVNFKNAIGLLGGMVLKDINPNIQVNS